MDALRRWRENRGDDRADRGAAVIEYALLVALISVMSLGALTFVGDTAEAMLDDVGQAVGAPPMGTSSAGGSSAGDSSGGDSSGGDSSGGDSSGGDSSGGDSSGGDSSGGDSSGGDSSGGDSSGGDSSGGDSSGSSTPVTVSTTFSDTSATDLGSTWRSRATVRLLDDEGQPLESGAIVRVKVTTIDPSSYGDHIDVQYENHTVTDGVLVLEHIHDDYGYDAIEEVRYEIVNVTFSSLDGPEWDGQTPSVTIDAP